MDKNCIILIIHISSCISGSATCIEDIYNVANRTRRLCRQVRFAKHCECPKSSCTATNAWRISIISFINTGRMLLIRRDPRKDLKSKQINKRCTSSPLHSLHGSAWHSWECVDEKLMHSHMIWIRVHYWLHPWSRFIMMHVTQVSSKVRVSTILHRPPHLSTCIM